MSNRKIQAVLAQMQKNLECSICLEMMKNPISTACGHQFCRFCIMEFLERKKQVPCPLCKKTVTKRGLMEREQLGQMVSDVHRLIEAYQTDTGTLFSPPRGSSMNMLPSTPEVIQPKATEMSSNKRNNVRRSGNTRAADKRKSATPKSEERETSLTEEEGTCRVKQSKHSAGNTAQDSRGNEENPQQNTDLQRLLDVIEMGTHGADNQDTACSSRNTINDEKVHVLGADKKDVNSKNSINDKREGVTSRRKTNDENDLPKHLNQKTDKTDKNHQRNHRKDFDEWESEGKQNINRVNSDIDLEISPSNSNIEAMIVGENDASDHENGEDEPVKVDEQDDSKVVVNDGLTQSSVSNVSQNSSEGVVSLFRIPLDVKELKQIQSNKTTRATRSQRYKSVFVTNNDKDGHNDDKINQNELSTLTPDINKEEKQVFTPELETIKTYSRKGSLDKDKSKRKVSDWLKNISNNKSEESAKTDDRSTDNAANNKEVKSKKTNQSKNMRAVQHREAVMGQRIKAFAEKVNQEDEKALFGFEGLDSSADCMESSKCQRNTSEENCFEGPTSVEHVNNDTANDKPNELKKDNENGALESETRDKQKPSESEQQCKLPVNKPTQRKRIFKTKRVIVETSIVKNCTNDKVDIEDSKNQNKPETVTDKVLPTSKPEETDKENLTSTKKSTRLLQLSDSPITSNQSSLDPYEFKSSQKTPQKPKSKATKRKRGRATTKTNTKNKIPFSKVTKTSTVDKTEVTKSNEIVGKLEMIQKSGLGSNLDKSENKHVSKQEVNQKSGLGKNENRHDSSEIKRLAADINQAEDYDLLTCTQEALNNMKDVNNEHQGKDSGASKKKVRFKEPSLADFISPGKINITLYRKEKEMYEKSAAAKNEPISLEDKNSSLKGGPNDLNALKGEREEMSACHNENQNQSVQPDENDVHDDNDSDDLSEDFRFHDDSSGTDDLDINPDQDEFEPVNIESQPEEIRDQLIEEGKLSERTAKIVEPTSEPKNHPAETSNLTDTTSKLQPPSQTKAQDFLKCKVTEIVAKPKQPSPEISSVMDTPQVSSRMLLKTGFAMPAQPIKDVPNVVRSVPETPLITVPETPVVNVVAETPIIADKELEDKTTKEHSPETEKYEETSESPVTAKKANGEVSKDPKESQLNSKDPLNPNDDLDAKNKEVCQEDPVASVESLDLHFDVNTLDDNPVTTAVCPESVDNNDVIEDSCETLIATKVDTDSIVVIENTEEADDDETQSPDAFQMEVDEKKKSTNETKDEDEVRNEDLTDGTKIVNKSEEGSAKSESVETVPCSQSSVSVLDTHQSERRIDDANARNIEENNSSCSSSGSRQSKKSRKKRKCFMLEDTQDLEQSERNDALATTNKPKKQKVQSDETADIVQGTEDNLLKPSNDEKKHDPYVSKSKKIDLQRDSMANVSQDDIVLISQNSVEFEPPNDKKKCDSDMSQRKQEELKTDHVANSSQDDIVLISQSSVEMEPARTKERHLSGILLSPAENTGSYKDYQSPEDIFCMDSEMPAVALSPEEDTQNVNNTPEEETKFENEPSQTTSAKDSSSQKSHVSETQKTCVSETQKTCISETQKTHVSDTQKSFVEDTINSSDRKMKGGGARTARGFSKRTRNSLEGQSSDGNTPKTPTMNFESPKDKTPKLFPEGPNEVDTDDNNVLVVINSKPGSQRQSNTGTPRQSNSSTPRQSNSGTPRHVNVMKYKSPVVGLKSSSPSQSVVKSPSLASRISKYSPAVRKANSISSPCGLKDNGKRNKIQKENFVEVVELNECPTKVESVTCVAESMDTETCIVDDTQADNQIVGVIEKPCNSSFIKAGVTRFGNNTDDCNNIDNMGTSGMATKKKSPKLRLQLGSQEKSKLIEAGQKNVIEEGNILENNGDDDLPEITTNTLLENDDAMSENFDSQSIIDGNDISVVNNENEELPGSRSKLDEEKSSDKTRNKGQDECNSVNNEGDTAFSPDLDLDEETMDPEENKLQGDHHKSRGFGLSGSKTELPYSYKPISTLDLDTSGSESELEEKVDKDLKRNPQSNSRKDRNSPSKRREEMNLRSERREDWNSQSERRVERNSQSERRSQNKMVHKDSVKTSQNKDESQCNKSVKTSESQLETKINKDTLKTSKRKQQSQSKMAYNATLDLDTSESADENEQTEIEDSAKISQNKLRSLNSEAEVIEESELDEDSFAARNSQNSFVVRNSQSQDCLKNEANVDTELEEGNGNPLDDVRPETHGSDNDDYDDDDVKPKQQKKRTCLGDVGSEPHGSEDDDDDDDDDGNEDEVKQDGEELRHVKQIRPKRAILSDSESDVDDGSLRLDCTSSSAFSSQSENLNTQERDKLESDLEKMAAEMALLRKQLNRNKTSMSKEPVEILDDDADDNLIEADNSDEEMTHEQCYSPPPFSPVIVSQEKSYDVMDQNQEDDTEMDNDAQMVPEEDSNNVLTVSGRQPLKDIDINIQRDQNNKPVKQKPLGFLATGLTSSQVTEIKKLAAVNEIQFYMKMTSAVTHVIVKPDDEDERMCDRTLKFFQGIANKCWIVSYQWIVDSKECGKLLSEKPYEIQGDTSIGVLHQGPKRSRLSMEHLFTGIRFCLFGDNRYLDKECISDLIQTCGGAIVDENKLSESEEKTYVICCSDLDDDSQGENEAVQKSEEIQRKYGISTLKRDWIMDSLTAYKLQPTDLHKIC